MKRREAEELLFYGLALIAAVCASSMLVIIIGNIALGAMPSLSWYFLTTAEVDTPGLGQGIANAIVGSVMIATFATIIAIPMATGTAIYLQKYARDTWATRSARFLIEVLSGTPSIVIGMFGLLVLVYYLQFITGGFSFIAGSIALAILIIPVIERAMEEAISNVPRELEEGSYALGATKWETIRGLVLPCAFSGLITGAILGFGRAAEESAVVIMTAGYTQFLPEFGIRPNNELIFGMKIYPLQDLVATLPVSVYHAYENSNVIPLSNAFAAAFVLIVIVLLVNLTAKIILWKYGHD